MFPYFFVKFFHNFRMFSKIILGILTSLSNLFIIICKPCTTLLYKSYTYCKIQYITLNRYSLAKHNIKLCFLKWWCHFILYNLNSCSVTNNFATLLERLNSSYIHSY